MKIKSTRYKSAVKKRNEIEKAIPEDVYPTIDNDLARDNIENDLPLADQEDI